MSDIRKRIEKLEEKHSPTIRIRRQITVRDFARELLFKIELRRRSDEGLTPRYVDGIRGFFGIDVFHCDKLRSEISANHNAAWAIATGRSLYTNNHLTRSWGEVTEYVTDQLCATFEIEAHDNIGMFLNEIINYQTEKSHD